jgi:hypothetical protein
MSLDSGFRDWLVTEAGFKNPRAISDEVWAGVKQFAYTYAIVIGQIGDQSGYIDRWCYKTDALAQAALDAWDGVGEPTGWHRHPLSGRRVSDNPNTIDDRGRRVPVGEMYHYA